MVRLTRVEADIEAVEGGEDMGLFGMFNKKHRKFKRRTRQVREGSWEDEGDFGITKSELYEQLSKEKSARESGLLNGVRWRIENYAKTMFDKLNPLSKERQDYAITRLTFNQMEQQVIDDPIILGAGIGLYNRCCQELISEKTIHIGNDKLEKKFLTKVFPAGKTHFRESMLDKNSLHHGIFGNALTEFVRGGKTKEVKDFITMDIRQFDFIEEGGRVKTIRGLPIGFYDERERNVHYFANPESKQLKDVNVLHSHINQIHYTEWGWGFAELMKTKTDQKVDLEDARSQKNTRKGYPVPIVRYGDDKHPPSPRRKTVAKKVARVLANPKSTCAWHPSYVTVGWLDDKSGENSDKNMSIDETQILKVQSAIMGIPVAVFLMTMEGQPGKGISELAEFFEINLKNYVRELKLETAIRIWANDLDLDVKIDYDEILSASRKERIMQIFRAGKIDLLLDPENPKQNKAIRAKLLEMLGLPTIEEGGEEVLEEDVKTLTKKLRRGL
jgi:hypothetical protein